MPRSSRAERAPWLGDASAHHPGPGLQETGRGAALCNAEAPVSGARKGSGEAAAAAAAGSGPGRGKGTRLASGLVKRARAAQEAASRSRSRSRPEGTAGHDPPVRARGEPGAGPPLRVPSLPSPSCQPRRDTTDLLCLCAGGRKARECKSSAEGYCALTTPTGSSLQLLRLIFR